jgi:transposase
VKKNTNRKSSDGAAGKSSRTQEPRPRQMQTKDVMANLVAKLHEKLSSDRIGQSDTESRTGPHAPNRDRLTVGVDLGDKWSSYCILGLEGEELGRGDLRTTPEDFSEFFGALTGSRVVLEVGTHSAWVREELVQCGHEVLIANPGQMEKPKHGKRKNDRQDAHKLARLGRVDPQSLFFIEHRSRAIRKDLVWLRARDVLVAVRTMLINSARGLVKSMGSRLPPCHSEYFANKVESAIPKELKEALQPLLELSVSVSASIQVYDKKIQQLASETYPDTHKLQQVKGVGALTSLAYVLTLERPARFVQSRDVGAYLGLVPAQCESGDSKPQLRITKTGDGMLRRLLVSSAHYILGPFGPDTDLRRYGERLYERGGKNAKKRAVVAVARKLAVLLHALWVPRPGI